MTESSLSEKISIIKKALNGEMSKPTYFDFYEGNNPVLVYTIYTSTNENLNYLTAMDCFENKDVLVPTASGDHALNAIFLGAKSVETFDINSIAKYHYNLKEAAIKVLPRDQFISFYSQGNSFFNKNTYEKISPFLKSETRLFFNETFSMLTKKRFNFQFLFAENPPSRGHFIRSNPYLKDDASYKTLQDKLESLKTPVSHKVCAAHEIENHFQKKDIIILSNIPSCYLGFGLGIKPILKSVSQVLAKNGSVSLNYAYASIGKLEKLFLSKKLKKSMDVKILPIENPRYKENDFVVIGKSK